MRLKVLCLILILSGCAITTTRPKLEMSLSQAAFLAAKDAKAHKLASSLFRKAEFHYLKAKSFYRKKFFDKAKQFAQASKKFSERAEYVAIRKQEFEGE